MVKSFFRNPCNVYFSLWCLYLLQGTLYASGSIISQALLAIIIIISFKHFVDSFKIKDKPIYFKGLTLLVLMYLVYGIFLFITDGLHTQARYSPPTYYYLKGYMISILPIYTCYIYARKGYLNTKMFQGWVILFVLVAIAEYFRLEREALEAFLENREITNNMGYLFLALMPCMMIYEKRSILQYLGIGICVVFILMAMKRGAIIIGAVALALFMLYKLRSAKGYQKILVSVIVVLGMYLLARYVEKLMDNSDYFNRRIEQTLDGDSSNRDVIYSTLWRAYSEDANFCQLVFGRGADGTLKVHGVYAHHDWLETLTNQGLLGVVLFFVYWLNFLRTCRNDRFCRQSKFVLFLIFSIFGLKTLFSMSIGDMTIYVSSILGFALADGFGVCKKEIKN